jgi:hypothetical protein
MNKPLIGGVGIMSQPEQPIPLAFLIFYIIIIPVLALLQPPFLLDSLWAICLDYFMQLAFVPKVHWWIIRHRCSYFNMFGFG